METIWFILIAILFLGYLVLDGFDLGVGIIYLLVAKTEVERDQVRQSIGPVWDGNEVWLIAAAGTLFFAFPKAYASLFSSFYLAFFLLLWLLILRGLAIEIRSQLDNSLWHTFWDVTFSFASLVIAGLLGILIGNLLRGIPFSPQSSSTLPFWTNFLPFADIGLLDWFTFLAGGLSTVMLVVQGASYLTLKTNGEIKKRVWQVLSRSIWVLISLMVIVLGAALWIQPVVRERYLSKPQWIILPVLTIMMLVGLVITIKRKSANWIFAASSLLILSFISTVMVGYYPNLLLAYPNPANSLTIFNSATNAYGLRVGLIWFLLGFGLLLIYVAVMYRSFWGKVSTTAQDGNY